MAKGIKFNNYKKLLKNLNDGDTGEMTRSEYRKKFIEVFAKDLENNFLNGHIYPENVKLINNRDYIGKFKIDYYPTCTDTKSTMYITFLADRVSINGLHVSY